MRELLKKARHSGTGRDHALAVQRRYVMEVHYPVLDKRGEKSSTAITGMDLHDIARACRTYGIKSIFSSLLCPSSVIWSKRLFLIGLKVGEHLITGQERGVWHPKDLRFSQQSPEMGQEKEKTEPFKIATTAKSVEGAVHWLSLKRRILEEDLSPVFIFGTGWGLHEDVLKEADSVMTPIAGGLDSWNHLSVRSAVSITLDRFFGWR